MNEKEKYKFLEEDKFNFNNKIFDDKIEFEKLIKFIKDKESELYFENCDFCINFDISLNKSIKSLSINNCEFNGEFSIKNVEFKGLTSFIDSEFMETVKLDNVSFEKFVSFRKSSFKNGLNLENINIEQGMNFFGVKGLEDKNSQEKTTRETYRIIKYQLQKVGNIIDANKYHSLELNKRRKEVCSESCFFNKSFLDCIVLTIHKITSNHSMNWIYVLFWIVIVGLITNALIHGTYDIQTWFSLDFYKYSYALTEKDKFCRNDFIYIANKIVLGYLYYQFLITIRKDTRQQ